MKLYFGWAFAWGTKSGEANSEERPAKAKLEELLLTAFKDRGAAVAARSTAIVLTTDPAYRPLIKERPDHPTLGRLLDGLSSSGIDPEDLEPLARRAGAGREFAAGRVETAAPSATRASFTSGTWSQTSSGLGDDPEASVPRTPTTCADPDDAGKAFEKKYAGAAADVPIFSDPRVVPTFHGVGPGNLRPPTTTKIRRAVQGRRSSDFVRWLDAHPDRPWALMMNYAAGPLPARRPRARRRSSRSTATASSAASPARTSATSTSTRRSWPRRRGEAMHASRSSPRRFTAAYAPLALAANAAKYRAVFGASWPADGAYREVVPCQSIGMTAFAPLCYAWGARAVGYESSAITSGLLALRMAFLRGAARQYGGLTVDYRSCNFGDASTIFSETQSYTKPRNILDNYYSVYSGAGMTWYKMDIWYQYMAGSSMFYHEQGFDEFWMPGGTSAAGMKPVQLSPKGKLVDRFLRVTAQNPDRGTPYTPRWPSWSTTPTAGSRPPFWPARLRRPSRPVDPTADVPATTSQSRCCASISGPRITRSAARKESPPRRRARCTCRVRLFGDIFEACDLRRGTPTSAKWTHDRHLPGRRHRWRHRVSTGRRRPHGWRSTSQDGGTFLLVADAQLFRARAWPPRSTCRASWALPAGGRRVPLASRGRDRVIPHSGSAPGRSPAEASADGDRPDGKVFWRPPSTAVRAG